MGLRPSFLMSKKLLKGGKNVQVDEGLLELRKQRDSGKAKKAEREI